MKKKIKNINIYIYLLFSYNPYPSPLSKIKDLIYSFQIKSKKNKNKKNIYMISFENSFAQKLLSYFCLHRAPLLPAFIWRFLPEYTFHQQKIHFLASISSARHIQSLDVDEDLLLSLLFSFSKFILPRFLTAFCRLFASCLSYLAILSLNV